MRCDFLIQLDHPRDHRVVSVTQVTCVGAANWNLGQRLWRFLRRDSRKRKKKRGTRQIHKRLSLQHNQSFQYLTGSPPSRQGCRLEDYKALF
jgi:hypothetical protein